MSSEIEYWQNKLNEYNRDLAQLKIKLENESGSASLVIAYKIDYLNEELIFEAKRRIIAARRGVSYHSVFL